MNSARILYIALAVVTLAAIALGGLWRYEVKDHEATKTTLTATKEKLKTANDTITKHEANIAQAERMNHAYQADIDRLTADVKRLRARPAKCKPVAPTPGLPSKPGARGEYASQDGSSSGAGIRTDWLYEYAIEAEQIRIERNACKDFVNQVWDAQK